MLTQFGADITRRQYAALSAACAIGTVCEWYDYTIFSQMNPILTRVFFPVSKNPAIQQLMFWSAYAVGFLARPFGSLLWGHVCDVVGRRVSLLCTLLIMTIPTVLIGCLPTYETAGVAAPIILCVLRLIQGIAVGGELGTAVVFMYELSAWKDKTKGGSVVFMGVTLGIILGIVVALVVDAAVPPAAMLVWGWRIPFLLAVFTATAGVVLRMHLPEPYEFINAKVKLQQQGQQTLAADAKQDSLQPSKATLPDGYGDSAAATDTTPLAAGPVLQQLRCTGSIAATGSVNAAGVAATAASKSGQRASLGGWLGHQPVRMLFVQHWREMLLLFFFETWSAVNFYVFYGWLPAHLATAGGIPLKTTMGMTLTNMTLTIPLIPLFAAWSDRGGPRMAATAIILALAAAGSIPMFMAVSTRTLAAAWMMQLTDLVLDASIFGFIPTIGSSLFPVHVRATGFNFCHTAGQSWLGGLSPVIITAIQVATGNTYHVTGIYLCVAAVISLVATLWMWKLYPQTNKMKPADMQHEPAALLPSMATSRPTE